VRAKKGRTGVRELTGPGLCAKGNDMSISNKQLDANRQNAQRSTGPRTPEGKAASSRNALTHGLTAQQIVLETESQAEFEEHAAELREEHQPSTPTAHILVDQLIRASWKLRRARIAEAYYYKQLGAGFRDGPDGPWLNITNLSDEHLEGLAREEGRAERSFYRALRELQRIRKERRPTPPLQVSGPRANRQNEPNSPPNPIIPFTTSLADRTSDQPSGPLTEPTIGPADPIK